MEEEMEVLGALDEDEGDEGEKEELQDIEEEDEADEGGTRGRTDTPTSNASVPIHEDGEGIDDNDDEVDDYPAPLENFLYLPILQFQIPAAPRTPRYNLPDSDTALRWTRMAGLRPQPSPTLRTDISGLHRQRNSFSYKLNNRLDRRKLQRILLSLHKSVLICSTQKVVSSADVVEEEVEEEMEVLGAFAEDEGDEGEKEKLQHAAEEDKA
ncbi:hypothetical protein VKT23_009687 [Stygiomarasmius scandens]|uniref:Uncharacterized protein n=1 Tax=Marasmiellus scandens TaxID=2682957 RepID=A0ABR1JFP9_9AGAR